MKRRAHIHAPQNVGEQVADVVTTFVGSWLCIGLHAIWFVLWIVLRVEAFPYGLLTMVVSLEAIFLSTLVMISQNRQSAKDRVRDNIESDEVQKIYDGHELLLQINQQQLDILTILKDEHIDSLAGKLDRQEQVQEQILTKISTALEKKPRTRAMKPEVRE